jgi:acetyl-CoA carboxylase biotin carboxyl carrier protein
MSGIDIDTALLEKLAELLQKGGLTEIEISQGETRIRVSREPAPLAVHHHAPWPQAAPVIPPAAEPAPAAAADDKPAEGTITAPMVGTVYLAPEPGAPPFVQVGDQVEAGQTLLIIEAMKVMNQIRAPRAGRIVRILVENAQPVEYGEPLLVLA